MTQAKAQTVVAAVVGAGYDARVHHRTDGTWIVRVVAPEFSIDSLVVTNFVAANGIVGTLQEVELS
jgi:hypothetical protein